MMTISNFNVAPGGFYASQPPTCQTASLEAFLAAARGGAPVGQRSRLTATIVPLDERFEPRGPSFVGEIDRWTSGALALRHVRPVNAAYLAIEAAPPDGHPLRLVLRVVGCESFGLDYEIVGQVMNN
ncbi:MAG: hypothetical protein ACREJM_09180 [Candidatus Saccharimonadales bacterium]